MQIRSPFGGVALSPQLGASMTAKDALDAAKDTEPGERPRRDERICGPRGACRRVLANDPGRWT
jgi:hypothetical protein